jgi:hypothetical protein
MTTQTDIQPAARLDGVLKSFFETKTACDVEGTMGYFAPAMICYMDATLGWDFAATSSRRERTPTFAKIAFRWSCTV